MSLSPEQPSIYDLPLGGPGLTSYRYKGPLGWVMIGAASDADALNEAKRSIHVPADPANLQVWSGDGYAQCASPLPIAA